MAGHVQQVALLPRWPIHPRRLRSRRQLQPQLGNPRLSASRGRLRYEAREGRAGAPAVLGVAGRQRRDVRVCRPAVGLRLRRT